MTVAAGGSGYFNFGNSGDVAAWDWECEMYFDADGTGYATSAMDSPWEYVPGSTMAIATYIDLDNQQAIMSIDGEWVAEWDWTGALGGVNFFGAAADTDSYTVDNFSMCVSEMPIITCQDEAACNFGAEGLCEYADAGFDCDGQCLDGGSSVTVDGGSWQGEVSWIINDCDGNIVAEGGAPYAACLDLPDIHTVMDGMVI
jgi:hypothetical protein